MSAALPASGGDGRSPVANGAEPLPTGRPGWRRRGMPLVVGEGLRRSSASNAASSVANNNV